MSELRDTMLLDASQPLAEIEKLEQRFGRLFRARELPPLRFPPNAPAPEPGGNRPQRRANEAEVTRLANRLRSVQLEFDRLGDKATDEQLARLALRLSRLTTQADLLAPGMDKGSRAAVQLGRVMNGLIGTSSDVQAALGRVGGEGLGKGVVTVDAQIKTLTKSVGTLRGMWQTQILTDEQAGKSALKLRDRLLQLASSSEASGDAVNAAVKAAAASQRVLDASKGDQTKGGIAYSASLGILDALGRAGGPVGAAAFGLGTMINSGLLGGLFAGKPRVGKGAQDIGDEVIKSLQARLQIRSPSRVTQAFGLNVAEGLAVGMKSGTALVAKAGFDLGQAADTGIGAGLRDIFGPKVTRQLNVSGGAFGGVAQQAKNGAAQLGTFALTSEQIGFVAGTATVAILAFGAAMASAVNSGARFEEQLVNIKALTQPTADEMGQLKDAAMNLGTDLGVGPTEAAKAILELNKAGLSASDAIGGGLAGALTLAGAAGVEANRGATLAVNGMNAFGLAAKDLPMIADVYANFANKTTLGAEDLEQFFSSLGPAAKDAGLNIQQVAGYAASLAQGGFRQMSDAGTSFKTLLSSLQAPSDTARKSLDALNVSFYDSTGAARPLGEVLEEVRQKLANLNDQQRNARIQEIFGADAGRAARVFFGTTNAAIDENIKAMGLQGEAARVARERMDSYAGQVKVLKAEWENFTAMIGLIFIPALTSATKGISGMIGGVRDFLNDGESLRRLLINVGIAVTGVGLAYVYLRREMILTAALNVWTRLPVMIEAARLAILGAAGAIKTMYIPAIASAAQATGAFLMANPWLLVIAGATAAAVAMNNIAADTRNTYAQVDEANQSSFENTMKRVRALQAEGTELSRTKAKFLLALEQQQDAQMGRITGVKWTGERIYTVDEEAVKRAQDRVKALRGEITALQAEQDRRGQRPGAVKTPLDPELVKKQTEVLKELRAELNGRQFELRVTGMTELGADLARLGNEFDQLSIKLKTAFGWDLTNTDLMKGLADLRAQRGAETTARIERDLKEQGKLRLDHERDVQAAEAALGRDALDRRRAEGEAQIREIRERYDAEIQAALTNSRAAGLTPGQRRQYQEQAGGLQVLQRREVAAAERQLSRELDDITQERLTKARAAQQATLDAQARTSAAVIKVLEGQRDRELALAGDVPAARLAIEERYASQIGRLQDEQRQVAAASQRSALLATYQQQLQDAEGAGAQRATLEREARTQYLLGLRTLELDQQAQTAADLLAREDRLQRERTAIYQQQLDRRMKGAQDATAAELRQLERVLQAERARAQSAGDPGKVAAIDQALTRINDIQADNVKAFREELRTAATTAADLHQQLAAIDQTPLGRARTSAASPFNGVIKGATQQLENLKKLLGKTDLDPDLRAQYVRQEADLTRVRTLAARQRNVAVLAAEQQFARDRQDKAQAAALKLATTEYDTTLNGDVYAAKLEQDRQYWEARLDLARRNGDEEMRAAAEQALASNADERKRLSGDTFTRSDALTASTLKLRAAQDEQQAALARTDAQLAASRARALQTARQELAALDDQLATAQARGLTEAQVNDLLTERLQKITSIQAQEHAASRAPLEVDAERVDLAQARAALALQLAGLADDDLAVSQQAVEDAREQLRLKRDLLAQAQANGSPSEVRQAETNELAAQLALEQAVARAADQRRQSERTALDHLEAQARAELELQGLQDDAVATAELELSLTRQRLALVQGQLADETLTPKQARDALLEQDQLLARHVTQQTKLAQARAQREREVLDLLELQARTQAQLTQMAEDAVATAELDADVTARKLALVLQQRANEKDEGRRLALLREELQLQGQLAEQDRKVLQARKDAADLFESTRQAHVALARELQTGSASARTFREALNSLADTRERLTRAERDYASARADFERFGTTNNAERLRAATEGLTRAVGDQRGALTKLADQYRTLITSMDGVRDAADRLKNASGGPGAPFQGNTEIDRYVAIERRRATAIDQLKAALARGDQEEIRVAADSLASQQERYLKQADLLKKNGINVNVNRSQEVRHLAQQLDALGIENDREAAALSRKAEAVALEAQSADTFMEAATLLDDTGTRLLAGLGKAADRLREAAQTPVVRTFTYVIEQSAKPKQPETTAEDAVASLAARMEGQRGSRESHTPPSTASGEGGKVVNITTTYVFHTSIDGKPSTTPQELEAAFRRMVGGTLDTAARNRAWQGGCPA